jgi:hypothetical protein
MTRTCRRGNCLGGQSNIYSHRTIAGTAMDPWKELAAREECRDAVRAWAELEAKSALVVKDMVRKYAAPARTGFRWPHVLAFVVHAAAWAYDYLWGFTRR